jgi:cysteine-rich repeat protein
VCGDGVVEGDEECDDGNESNNDACMNCVVAVCGDGIIQDGVEECDTGPNIGDDQACTSECLANVCGDGHHGPGEGCDDGNDIDGDECTNECKTPDCGDGVLDPVEDCDDGNDDDADACLSTCVDASCGDGHVFAEEEECDDAEFTSDTAMCTSMCKLAVCGDGLVLLDGEECDDGEFNSNTAMCTADCAIAVCGDGLIYEGGGEECDAGMDIGNDQACTSECLANVCGDGYQGPGEGCDDGNDIDGDDCTNACAPVGCGDLIVGPGEECEDGNDVENDACLSTCASWSCGDGFVFAEQEECDEAELNSDSAMCTGGCTVAVCGDGLVWDGVEECDEGDLNSDSAMCKPGCVAAVCGDGLVWEGVEDCDDANASDFDVCTSECSDFVAPTLQLSLSQVKQFDFSWDAVVGAEYYQLLESADMGAPYVQVSGDVMGLATSLTVPVHFRLNASYKLRACKDGEGCVESAVVDTVGALEEAIGYFKASNSESGDAFGTSVAVSGDGSTVAVGVPYEDSNATGIGGNQADNSRTDAGAVYVFVRNGQGVWTQQAYVKASTAGANDEFGFSVALNEDGSTLAVGTHYEDSNAVGIGGNQADNSNSNSGAAYVFVRNGQGVWTQQAYVKASNSGTNDEFGHIVALSGDGGTLVVGARWEDSTAVGINGQNNDFLFNSGAAYVFVRNGQGVWTQQAYVKASNPGMGDFFGSSVALNGDGSTLVVGARGEDSIAVGIGGNQGNDSATGSGAVYVFVRNGQGVWTQQAYVKASNTGVDDEFGYSVALSEDGNTMAVGARYEGSNAVGIGGNQANNSAYKAGAAYVFVRNGQGVWTQQVYVKASNTNASDEFGSSVSLSGDGSILAVGAGREASGATGIGGDQANNTPDAGAVYVFVSDGQWSQQAYVKASNTHGGDFFGQSVALSADGSILVVGAYYEASNTTGIGGNQADKSAIGAGAVYVY